MAQRRISVKNKEFRNYSAEEVDFYAIYIWYIDTFFIITYEAVKTTSITVSTKHDNNKYQSYKNNWEQLLRK